MGGRRYGGTSSPEGPGLGWVLTLEGSDERDDVDFDDNVVSLRLNDAGGRVDRRKLERELELSGTEARLLI